MEFATEPQKKLMSNLKIDFPPNISKKDASGLIDAAVKQQTNVMAERASSKASYTRRSDTNFYVSYAKDLVIAMYQFNQDTIKGLTLDEVMQAAIIAIDNAKTHFDNHGN